MNDAAVGNNGNPPTFDTRTLPDSQPGRPDPWHPGQVIATRNVRYCLARIETYHWNNATGKAPGTLGLTAVDAMPGALGGTAGGPNTAGPYPATGTPGQGNVQNANWSAEPAAGTPPVVLQGEYRVDDSDPDTWSQNTGSHGNGFVRIYVRLYAEG